MSTLDSHDGSDTDGYTLITSAGTVASNGSVIVHDHIGANSWTTHGLYRTDGQTGAEGHVVYCQAMMTSETSKQSIIGLTHDKEGIGYLNTGSIYFNSSGDGLDLADAGTPIVTGETWDAGSWYDFKMEINSSGYIDFSYRDTDDQGSLDPTSSSWTTLGSTGSASGDLRGTEVRIMTAVFTANNELHLDEFYYTDDGLLTVAAAAAATASGATAMMAMGIM